MKRIALYVLTLAALCTLFTGCRDKKPTTPTTMPPVTTQPTAAPTTEAATTTPTMAPTTEAATQPGSDATTPSGEAGSMPPESTGGAGEDARRILPRRNG